MKHERIFVLQSGRAAKVIITGILASDLSKVSIDIDVLVKDPKEDEFRAPIGISHPKYWKLQRLTDELARKLQIQYSGISEKQIRKAVKEFEKMMDQEISY